MLAVLIAALAHDVPEQDAALRRVDHVFHGGRKQAEHGHGIREIGFVRMTCCRSYCEFAQKIPPEVYPRWATVACLAGQTLFE